MITNNEQQQGNQQQQNKPSEFQPGREQQVPDQQRPNKEEIKHTPTQPERTEKNNPGQTEQDPEKGNEPYRRNL
jgi:hypothetical protein